MNCSLPGFQSFTISQSLLKLMSIESAMPCNQARMISIQSPPSSLALSFPASGSFPMSQVFTWGGQSIGVSASTSVLPMNTQDWSPLGWTGWISWQSKGLERVFSSESALCTRWPKYWSFSFSISPSNEYPGLISFRMDWLDLLAVQGTLKSLQHHSSKASILHSHGFPQAAAPVGVFSRGTTRTSGSLSCGALPDPGIELWSPALQADTLTFEPRGPKKSVWWEHSVQGIITSFHPQKGPGISICISTLLRGLNWEVPRNGACRGVVVFSR